MHAYEHDQLNSHCIMNLIPLWCTIVQSSKSLPITSYSIYLQDKHRNLLCTLCISRLDGFIELFVTDLRCRYHPSILKVQLLVLLLIHRLWRGSSLLQDGVMGRKSFFRTISAELTISFLLNPLINVLLVIMVTPLVPIAPVKSSRFDPDSHPKKTSVDSDQLPQPQHPQNN
jgi:hypothetical protein